MNSQVHIFGWGSEKLEDPPKKLSDVHMSTILKEIEIKITRAVPCEIILGRSLSKNQVCGKGVNKGETAAQVTNFNKICRLDLRGALFIFRALATLSVLKCHLTFALESSTFDHNHFLNVLSFECYLCPLQLLENCVSAKKWN